MHREDPDATTSAQSGSTIPIMDIDDLLVQAQSCVTHNPQQEDKSDRNIIAYYPTNGSETSGEDSPVAKSQHRSMSVFPNSSSSEEGSVSSDDPAETAKGDHTGSSSDGRSSEGSECGDEFQSKQTSFNEESSSQVSDDFSSQDISSQMLARTPLFSMEHITSKYKIFDVLLKADDVDPSKICQKVPFRPEKQLCFLIDTSSEHIKHRDDIRSDGNGTYTHTGVHKDYFSQSAKKVSDCSEAKYLLKPHTSLIGPQKCFAEGFSSCMRNKTRNLCQGSTSSWHTISRMAKNVVLPDHHMEMAVLVAVLREQRSPRSWQ